jgi:hypothetical protein
LIKNFQGVWLKDLELDRPSMPSHAFAYHIGDSAVWISPVNADEMSRLHNGEKFTLSVCTESPTNCLCWGGPNFTHSQVLECWQRAAKATYKDVVPRHMHS